MYRGPSPHAPRLLLEGLLSLRQILLAIRPKSLQAVTARAWRPLWLQRKGGGRLLGDDLDEPDVFTGQPTS